MQWALAALLLSAAPATTPAPTPEAKQSAAALARQAIADYKAGNYEKALAETEEAYKQDPRPGLVYNLAQCHRALQHWERAEFFYRDYLEQVPKAPNRSALTKLIEEMAALHLAEKAGPRPPPPPPDPDLEVVPLVAPPPPVAAPQPIVQPPPVVQLPLSEPALPLDAAVPSPFLEHVEAEAPHHARVWPWLLGSLAVVSIGACVWGFLQVSSFDSLKSQSQQSNVGLTQLLQSQSAAQTGQVVGIAGVVAAVGLGTGAVLTW